MVQARADTRDGAKTRRARTRHLIELGGLVQKSGLLEAVAAIEPDVRAVLLGALLDLADELRSNDSDPAFRTGRVIRWRERGRTAFRAEPAGGLQGASSPDHEPAR